MKLKNVKINDLPHIAESLVSSLNNSKSKKSTVVHLVGNLGSGKTTFVKHVAEKLGIKDHIQSPTFTLMREYELVSGRYNKLIHIDAYRFDNKEESEVLNIDSYIKDQNLIFIEWPDKMRVVKADITITIARNEDDSRDFDVD